jgi:diguanylate cyclase
LYRSGKQRESPVRKNKTFVVLVPLILFVLALAGAEWIVRGAQARMERDAHDHVFASAAGMRSRVESALNSAVFLAQGLVAYVAGVETPAEPQVSRVLKALHDADDRIRNVGLAPGNRLTFIYPEKGNERALGLQFEDHPAQWPSVRKAIETRQSVLAGPVELVQGGTAIINRTPIFLPDGRYWGVISTVIDLSRLLASAGLAPEVSGVRYVLYGDNADGAAARVLGDEASLDARAIRMDIEVPGGRWSLVAMPAAGWADTAREVHALRALLWGLSAVFAGFAFALLRGRAMAGDLAASLARLNDELTTTNRELFRLSRNDTLTHLPNRRSFEEAYAAAWRTCQRNRMQISVLMVDIDRFKSINDTYGHSAGDATLVEVAAAVQGQMRRADDIVARWGGEEFIVMVVGLGPAAAESLGECIRAAAAQCRVQVPGEIGLGGPVSVSVGVATTIPTPGSVPNALIDAADSALYAAKNSGRNRVCAAHCPADTPAAADTVTDVLSAWS